MYTFLLSLLYLVKARLHLFYDILWYKTKKYYNYMNYYICHWRWKYCKIANVTDLDFISIILVLGFSFGCQPKLYFDKKKKIKSMSLSFKLSSAAQGSCQELELPANGGLVCVVQNRTSTTRCIVKCDEGYEHVFRPNFYESCGPDTNWKWSNQINGRRIYPCEGIVWIIHQPIC